MADYLHDNPLYIGPLVAIHDVCCKAKDPACGPKEEVRRPSLAIPRRGVFVKHVGGDDIIGDANTAIFFRPGETYRVSHPVPGGDDCTSFQFAGQVLDDALGRDASTKSNERPPRFAPLDSSVVLTAQRLRQCLTRSPIDRLVVEETALAILAAALRRSSTHHADRSAAVRPSTGRAHREWTESARIVLNRRIAERVQLDEVAGEVYCSAFHLARIFKRRAGMPMHRYLLRLRLRRAIERVLDGERDLTALALDLGFASHAHLSDAFRREFGCPPSGLRRSLQPADLLQMSKNLEALPSTPGYAWDS